MTTPKIIAFTGKKHCGKTSAAKYLVTEHGFTRISFADPMKQMLLMLGVPRENLWGDQKEVPLYILGGKSARHAMQTLGTEWGRQMVSDTIWTSAWELLAMACMTPIVVDDMRFLNESKVIRKLHGKIILIERPETDSEDLHVSEVELSRIACHGKIINDGSILEFKAKLNEFLEKMKLEEKKRTGKALEGLSNLNCPG